jgi:phytoene synthase
LPAGDTSDEWLLATHGRTFHFAARFLPAKPRSQVFTLYAFFRTLDDMVDIPVAGRGREDIRAELEAWKCWFAGGYSVPAPQEPVGSRLAAILAEHPVPATVFLDFLDGLTTDLEPCEFREFRDLYHYCYGVAGTVGLALARVMGVNSPQALAAAQSLGIGMQLTNILRDVGGDLAAGRVYLPQEDLARFGSSPLHLARLYQAQRGPDERFRALMRYQITRAHHYYVQGMSGIWLLPRHCRLPILVAGRLYRRILTVIEQNDYDVLRARAATSIFEKAWEAAIAFALNQLWCRGEASLFPDEEILLES